MQRVSRLSYPNFGSTDDPYGLPVSWNPLHNRWRFQLALEPQNFLDALVPSIKSYELRMSQNMIVNARHGRYPQVSSTQGVYIRVPNVMHHTVER